MKRILLALVLCAGLAWVAYGAFGGKGDVAGIAPAAGEGGAPMPVQVMTLTAEDIQQWHEFSGNLVAVERVEIRPRVGGAINKIYFTPGVTVEKDAPLFLIDPRPYQAAVNRAAADLAVARTQAALAKTESERADRLIKENAIAQRAFDERQNAFKVANATVQSGEAALQQAKLNLDYATIKAPVRGKISRAEITEGNLVEPNTSLLATLVSTDPIYADFDIDEQTYLANIRKADQAEGVEIPVELVLKNDESVSYSGKIVSFDNKLDPATGTLRARAIFENKDEVLVPGMFAKIRLGNAEKTSTILVPETVIGTDQDKRFLYVVDDKGLIAYRQVKLGAMANGMRIISEGVAGGDRIVTNGLQRLRPGMPVAPQETKAITPEVKPAEEAAAIDATAEAVTEPVAEAPVAEEAPAAEEKTDAAPVAEALPEPIAAPKEEPAPAAAAE